MTSRFALPLGLLIAWSLTTASSAVAQPAPCTAPEHREFDFWIGEWTVYQAGSTTAGAANSSAGGAAAGTNTGTVAGTNSITREMGGCVLHERYRTPNGYTGESFNIYDASRKRWHQTWVDSGGVLLVLEGGLTDGRMVLSGQTTGADGTVTTQRISWTPNADGTVRQLWESSKGNGAWTVAFDGVYVRK